MDGAVVYDNTLDRTYQYSYSDGDDSTDNSVEIELCFPDKTVYTIGSMMVPKAEFRVQITGIDVQGNSFTRLDPGVYSPARLEVEIGKVSDQVLTTGSSMRFNLNRSNHLTKLSFLIIRSTTLPVMYSLLSARMTASVLTLGITKTMRMQLAMIVTPQPQCFANQMPLPLLKQNRDMFPVACVISI